MNITNNTIFNHIIPLLLVLILVFINDIYIMR
jgi:hypothetical protein